ncbi:glycoside hydrolase family 13 protein [Pseudocercospora fijiensis CIRAD86]|uniref:Alpha-glucosidase n=1 Tax=Pseudocercospora fijiensis (strain CIRAD86) TaxID=383855 RepID=M3AHE2_PSEFD|nr:glycoside hydrolase family 13 protein [Pseudocercospora fijiensis CIRAD86]EME76922.1 glycoside hydrolase family 13 protein [Pseudocercospora fijiensis CIRAD86]
MATADKPWWKDAVVYQIYPASFKDSNSDGIGDIPGIIQSLDYIQSIGVDVIWICPMYASPQVDMGYDVSDYKSVYPPYGTVQDMEILIKEAHSRGLRIILDLVINHTSDQHAWFKESRASKDSPKRDWYFWQPAKYDADGTRKPPNNWRSAFQGSAWSWDEQTQEYYLHLFAHEQPDLNFENPELRKVVYEESMIFWLDKGIDGFRIDCANIMSKPPGFPDAPITDPEAEYQEFGPVVCNGPRILEYHSEIGAILNRYGAMSVGECPHTSNIEQVMEYVGASKKRLNMIFQFDVCEVGCGKPERFDIEPFAYELIDLKRAILLTQSFLSETDGWTTTFIENHDLARSVSRFGDDGREWRERSAKLLAILFASLSGTLFVYQGQEIGMINIPKDWPIEEYKDIGSINYYETVRKRSHDNPEDIRKARESLQHLAREHSRTPMQWTSGRNGGFTGDEVVPWMRVNTSTSEINVAEQLKREDSVLVFWRRMLQVRRQLNDVLVHGYFELVDEDNKQVFTFLKRGTGRSALVVCNFSGSEAALPDCALETGWKLQFGNVSGSSGVSLGPWEGRIYTSA